MSVSDDFELEKNTRKRVTNKICNAKRKEIEREKKAENHGFALVKI